MSNLLQITVEPHVETYVRHHYGKQLMLSDDNFIILMIKPLLKPFSKQDPWKIKPTKKYSLGGVINLWLSDGMMRKYGGFLTDEDIKAISVSIDLVIKQEMYRWCHHPNATDEIVDYNIKRFIDFYGFSEDDLTFDNLKRWYYRERKRLLKRKSERDVLLTIPLLLSEIGKDNPQLAIF
ncbi:hypothetical protein ACR777_15165 [Sphingobacterium spiritivorum]|uniref:hypothetical protein n=1 Tax=Sphingobacterium spiritivorum TaxID=258 RepID=UPI003DA57C47